MKKLINLQLPDDFSTAFEAKDMTAASTWQVFLQAKAALPEEMAVLAPYDVAAHVADADALFVAADGDDGAVGTADAPLASVAEAVRRKQRKGGGAIYLRGGVYMQKETVCLDETHSGQPDKPLMIAAYPHERVTLTTATKICGADFVSVTDESVLARLSVDARDHVVQVDLKKYGITEYGSANETFFYVNHKMQTLARYPNAGKNLYYESKEHMNIVRYGHPETTALPPTPDSDDLPGFEIGLPDGKPLSWQEGDIWMYGTPYEEWAKDSYPVKIKGETRTLVSEKTSHWGVRFNPHNYFYFFNVLEELDQPEEWYLDRNTGILYYYPPKGIDLSTAIFHYASPKEMFAAFSLQGTKNVVFSDLLISSVRMAIECTETEDVLIQHCVLSNTVKAALFVKDGVRTGAVYSSFSYAGEPLAHFETTNVSLSSPNCCFVQNCRFEGYYPGFGRSGSAIFMKGVGNVVSHNDMNEMSISSHAIDSVYEYNVIRRGFQLSYDWGPLYIGGSSTKHGQHVRYNTFYDLTYNLYGIYLDDMSSGHFIYGNTVHYKRDNPQRHTRGVNIHGGRENVVFNNIVVGAGFFGVGAPDAYTSSNAWIMRVRQFFLEWEGVNEQEYARRYPIYTAFFRELQAFYDREGRPMKVTDIRDQETLARLSSPSNNLYINNVLAECGTENPEWCAPIKTAKTEIDFILRGNLILDDKEKIGFADEANGDFSFGTDSAVYREIPDFIPIRSDRMGIVGGTVGCR